MAGSGFVEEFPIALEIRALSGLKAHVHSGKEIRELGCAVCTEHDVFGLDVAMRETKIMCVYQRAGNLLGICEDLLEWESVTYGSHGSDVIFEPAAGEIFGDHERLRVCSPKLANSGDVRMFQPEKIFAIAGLDCVEKLHGDPQLGFQIAGLVYSAPRTFAEYFQKFIPGNRLFCHLQRRLSALDRDLSALMAVTTSNPPCFQKISFSANWSCREVPFVWVITPAEGL